MKMNLKYVAILLLSVLAAPAFAHGGHDFDEPEPTATPAPTPQPDAASEPKQP